MILRYQKFIARADLRDNPDTVYAFGDNLTGTGYGGQAGEMRGEPNAIGIPTKRSPYEYLKDDDFWDLIPYYRERFRRLYTALNDGREIVFPSDGFGTGLANLQKKSPQCWGLLQLFLKDFLTTVELFEKEAQEDV